MKNQLSLVFTKSQKEPLSSLLPWIKVIPGVPYFMTESNEAWTPIGQNDAITWPELEGLFNKKNIHAVESYFTHLRAHGVTCLRVMLEYCQGNNRYFENPVGHFQPNMLKLWDDFFLLCEKYSLRILLTPFDTYWMWRRWKYHPYNKINLGPCGKKSHWFLCKETLSATKTRLEMVVKRWGGSGALFAWDLWNEISPVHSNNSVPALHAYITEISTYLRELEVRHYGRSHLQTVSVFSTTLDKYPELNDLIFKHPCLDFATSHFYDPDTINRPKNTLSSAIKTGQLVEEALTRIDDARPFFDSEHGPINTFKTKRTLEEKFDDTYFRHIQWAHFASGGSGGGMRWPYRHPHTLTDGMRKAQRSLSGFLGLIDWKNFRRRNLNHKILLSRNSFIVFGCGDSNQVIMWLLRRDLKDKGRRIGSNSDGLNLKIEIPEMNPGTYKVSGWNTSKEKLDFELEIRHLAKGILWFESPPIFSDIAIAIRKMGIGFNSNDY